MKKRFDENIEKLLKEFLIIRDRNWIKSISSSDGSVGITFESLLGIKENNSVLPDYNGIELKCTASKYSYPITLFSTKFDGPTQYEMQRIVNLYGKPDSTLRNKKILYSSLSCNSNYLVNNKYNFRIKIDNKQKRIYLVILDNKQIVIEERSFICFNTLKLHLFTKLKYLAVINAQKKYINGEKYFNYFNLELFRLKKFDYFIESIEKDIVKVSMNFRINKRKFKYGKVTNRSVIFSIKKTNLKYIFEKINYTN